MLSSCAIGHMPPLEVEPEATRPLQPREIRECCAEAFNIFVSLQVLDYLNGSSIHLYNNSQ